MNVKAITLYGKSGCINYEKAKMLCRMKGINFNYKQLGVDIDLPDLLKKIPQRKAVSLPQIFVQEGGLDTAYIGGYNELLSLSY